MIEAEVSMGSFSAASTSSRTRAVALVERDGADLAHLHARDDDLGARFEAPDLVEVGVQRHAGRAAVGEPAHAEREVGDRAEPGEDEEADQEVTHGRAAHPLTRPTAR